MRHSYATLIFCFARRRLSTSCVYFSIVPTSGSVPIIQSGIRMPERSHYVDGYCSTSLLPKGSLSNAIKVNDDVPFACRTETTQKQDTEKDTPPFLDSIDKETTWEVILFSCNAVIAKYSKLQPINYFAARRPGQRQSLMALLKDLSQP